MENKIRRMEIEPADNGFTVTTHHEPNSSDLKKGTYPFGEPEKTVHPDANSVAEHVRKKLGGTSKKHPGFKAVQNNISRREGISNKAAGAILASRSRGASAAAHKANPRLNRVR